MNTTVDPASIDSKYTSIPTTFNFRTVTEKDDKGNVVSKTKRPSVELPLKLLTLEGIADIFVNGSEKAKELLLEAVRNVQTDAAKVLVDEKLDVSDSNFDYSCTDWDKIANAPKESRRGAGIPKEVWEDFCADYLEVMPGLTGKSVGQIENQVKALASRFQTVKFNKKILEIIKDCLDTYAASAPAAVTYQEVIVFLQKKAEEFLNKDEADLF